MSLDIRTEIGRQFRNSEASAENLRFLIDEAARQGQDLLNFREQCDFCEPADILLSLYPHEGPKADARTLTDALIGLIDNYFAGMPSTDELAYLRTLVRVGVGVEIDPALKIELGTKLLPYIDTLPQASEHAAEHYKLLLGALNACKVETSEQWCRNQLNSSPAWGTALWYYLEHFGWDAVPAAFEILGPREDFNRETFLAMADGISIERFGRCPPDCSAILSSLIAE